ncbi:MAG: DUF4465 domain-containing protein, partial [Myxococcota bacterium]
MSSAPFRQPSRASRHRGVARRLLASFALCLPSLSPGPASAGVIDFEVLGAALPAAGPGYYDGADGAGGFSTQGAHFANSYSAGFWQAFAYSQHGDSVTPGFGNQWSAFPGSGANGSATFAVGFQGYGAAGQPRIQFDAERMLQGAHVTNTTYAALSMRDGDPFAKAFGGVGGTDPDFLRLRILGYDSSGNPTGSVDFYLADFRFADSAQDYIVNDWRFVDLSSLGGVQSLRFEVEGSDVGSFGLNTPGYFALDNLQLIPEPGSLGLAALGLAMLAFARPRRTARFTALLMVCAGTLPAVKASAQTGYAPELMQAWATSVHELLRGPLDIADPGAGAASYGEGGFALGPATGDSADVVSLGDGGSISLHFASGISDGPGDDLAVFENGFFTVGGLFGEFAFVEVSSNGVDFGRFENTCNVTQPVPGFGALDPSDYQGLAGDQAIGSGTGFDLAEFADHPLVNAGALNLLAVSHVRIIDVIGDGSATDSLGWPIYDPYPTAFATGGFDLEAIGVLHAAPEPAPLAQLPAGLLALLWLSRRPPGRSRTSRAP